MPYSSQCQTCGKLCYWEFCPTGGWWIHLDHPSDDHDAIAQPADVALVNSVVDKMKEENDAISK